MNTQFYTDKAQSLAIKPRNNGLIWTGRILISLIITILALAVIGAIYQAVGAQADQRNFPPPGRLYDVGGYRLHLYCTGPQDSGNPTVILDTMSGGTSANWGWIQPEIAQVTRVCSYDRAGRGWSEPSPHPKTLQQAVSDLHLLLQAAGIKSPYVLVGHSIGGIYMRQYTANYPGEVAGLVLIDTAHPDQFIRNPQLQAESDAYLRQSAIFPTLARLGLFRFYFATGNEIDFAGLPKQQHDEVAAFWSSPEYFDSQREEIIAGPGIFAEAHALGRVGDLPLAVVTRSENQPAGWAAMQDELAALSSNSIHITVPNSTHASLAFDRENAHQTSSAILKVLAAARTSQPLASK